MALKNIHIIPRGVRRAFSSIGIFSEFFRFLYAYSKKKVLTFSHGFERQKNKLVKLFMMKRGRYNRPFLHMVSISVLGIIIILAPIIADTYPIFTQPKAAVTLGQ